MKNVLQPLYQIRNATGHADTVGISDEAIVRFAASDAALAAALKDAPQRFRALENEFGKALTLPEVQLVNELQEGILNFYPPETVSPYVPLIGRGPWMVTTHGAVVYDAGGYGMLGFGHTDHFAKTVLSQDHVMANVMTPSLSHRRFVQAMQKKIGYRRMPRGCPYHKFLTMNSGSEALTVAARISDAHAKQVTEPGGPHHGKSVAVLALTKGFHGRTDRPARASSSSWGAYQSLASFRDNTSVHIVPPNDTAALERAFCEAKEQNIFYEAMFMEPVMGEGQPGLSITPEYYTAARRLTHEHRCALIVDSVQAGLRAYGCLSVVDYPGFEALDPPDMEAFSKALSAGQYPLSALALHSEAAQWYVPGIYGNTMTGNPRALELACEVLSCLDSEVSRNIGERGKELREKLEGLAQLFPDVVLSVVGTGLLLAVEINQTRIRVVGNNGLEKRMRCQGLNVIHGGMNALRYTPHFKLTSAEVDLIVSITEYAIRESVQA